MFRHLRSFLSHSRVPLKVHATAPRDASIFRVRFVKHRSGPTGKLFYAVGTTICTGLIAFRVIQAMGMSSGQPVFLPLSFPRKEEHKPYPPDAPEVRDYHKFVGDRDKAIAARKTFQDITVSALQTAIPGLGQVRSIHTMLYFHFPIGPPQGYLQKGIQFSFSQPVADPVDPEIQRTTLQISYVERHIKAEQYVRNESILYPRWMFDAVKKSILEIWDDIITPIDPQDVNAEEDKINDVYDLVQYGVDVSQWTFTNIKADLKRTRKKVAPQDGFIMIDGMVQVISSNYIVSVDLTGSFNPTNPQEALLHRMSVRYAKKVQQQYAKEQRQREMAQRRESVLEAVRFGPNGSVLKSSKETTVSAKDDKILEKRDASGDAEKQKHPDAVHSSTNTRVEKDTTALEGEKKDGATRQASAAVRTDSPPPPTPKPQQSPPPPRE